MIESNDLKKIVKEKYSEIAKASSASGCCGPLSSCCGDSPKVEFTMIGDDYKNIEGYVEEADLGLGCGLPTEFAEIYEGDTVIDLGSGAGNDVFIVRALVGETGKVIGLDFTEEMLLRANSNKEKHGYTNVEFMHGEIESMPFEENFADVIVSNCVLNLVPDKQKAFSEIYRVLKPGAHFCISDIVIKGELHPELKKSAELYAGCISGALQQKDYIATIKSIGFKDIEIRKTKEIKIPDEFLKKYLNENELKEFREKQTGVFSITITGFKRG